MVRTSVLRNQTAWATRTAPANAFIPIGSRGLRGQSSTTDMTFSGILFAAQVQLEGVSCWDTRKPYNLNNVQMVQRDPVLLGFVNDLKLDTDRENVSSEEIQQRIINLFLFVCHLGLGREQ